MKSFDAYKKYVALKLHFQSKDYDYFKFSGSIKVSREKFETRNDKYFFERICKIYNEEQYQQLLISNLIANKDAWVGDIFSENGRNIYSNWKKTQQSLEYVFRQDMEKLLSMIESKQIAKFDDLFIATNDSNWPQIVECAINKTISLESFLILNKIFNFVERMDKKIDDDLIWPEFKQTCLKYSPFIMIDISRYKKILKELFL